MSVLVLNHRTGIGEVRISVDRGDALLPRG